TSGRPAIAHSAGRYKAYVSRPNSSLREGAVLCMKFCQRPLPPPGGVWARGLAGAAPAGRPGRFTAFLRVIFLGLPAGMPIRCSAWRCIRVALLNVEKNRSLSFLAILAL